MTGEEIAGLIVGELTMNVSMSDANAAVLHDAICAAIDKERAHAAALEEELREVKETLETVSLSSTAAIKEQVALARRLEKVVEAARAYLNASSRIYVESGQMTTPKARAKTALLAALADLDATR